MHANVAQLEVFKCTLYFYKSKNNKKYITFFVSVNHYIIKFKIASQLSIVAGISVPGILSRV